MTKEGKNKYDVIVIGGGSSGIFAAGVAAERGKKVLILEKNSELGKKLKITGGGRCNITNAETDVKKFLEKFPESKKFLYSPFSKFSSKDTFTFFENKLNFPLVTQARKRVFPATEKALDVYKVLEKYLKKNKVEILLNKSVTKINKGDDRIISVHCGKDEYFANSFILSTGGYAAPETGSTGDGFRFLEKLGHNIKKPNPNIVPLTTNAKWVHNLAGVTLSFMKISFKQEGKTKIKKTGKILFTHFGISSPLILNSSYEVKKLLEKGPVTASVDMFPDTEEHELDRRIWRIFERNKNKMVKNVLTELIPKNILKEILEFESMVDGDKPVNEVTKEERNKITKKLKSLEFPITGTLGFDKAVIADGGVVLEEVNFNNMTSKLYSNLYLIGDTLSINRPSGGYSLQLCWTTGWIAGNDC
jgi:predicted Rossmann fold flavoprotein